MWRLIRKWWFLQQLEAAIALHTGKASVEEILSGKTVLLTQEFFIKGTDKYPGIALKPVGRFSWILFWRRWESPEKLKGRIHEYNNFFKYWIEEKYIEMQQTARGIHMPATTYLADDVHGWFGLIQLLGNKFAVPWGIISAIITFFIGLNWHGILNYLKELK
jgi:hypothetical protein